MELLCRYLVCIYLPLLFPQMLLHMLLKMGYFYKTCFKPCCILWWFLPIWCIQFDHYLNNMDWLIVLTSWKLLHSKTHLNLPNKLCSLSDFLLSVFPRSFYCFLKLELLESFIRPSWFRTRSKITHFFRMWTLTKQRNNFELENIKNYYALI